MSQDSRTSKRSFLPSDMVGSYNFNAVALFASPAETGKPGEYHNPDPEGGAIKIGEMTYRCLDMPNPVHGNVLNVTESDGITLNANNVQVTTTLGNLKRTARMATVGAAQEVVNIDERHKVFSVKTGFCNTYNTGFRRIQSGHFVYARHLKKGETHPTVETGRPRPYPVMEPFPSPYHVHSRALTQVRKLIADQAKSLVANNRHGPALKQLISDNMFAVLKPKPSIVTVSSATADHDAFTDAWSVAFDSDFSRILQSRSDIKKKAHRLGLLENYITYLITLHPWGAGAAGSLRQAQDLTLLVQKVAEGSAELAADFQNEYWIVGKAYGDADPSFGFRCLVTTTEG